MGYYLVIINRLRQLTGLRVTAGRIVIRSVTGERKRERKHYESRKDRGRTMLEVTGM